MGWVFQLILLGVAFLVGMGLFVVAFKVTIEKFKTPISSIEALWLKRLSIGSLILAYTIYAGSTTYFYRVELPETRSLLLDIQSRLLQKYGFRIGLNGMYKSEDWCIHNFEPESADLREITRMSEKLEHELNIYPAGLIQKLNLSRILLVKGLTWKNEHMGGLSLKNERDIYIASNAFEQIRMDLILHHEIMHHMLNLKGTKKFFDAWGDLNPEDFEYFSDPLKGLAKYGEGQREDICLSRYAQTNTFEDICVIFEYMMASQYHQFLEREITAYPIIRKKVEFLNEWLIENWGFACWNK